GRTNLNDEFHTSHHPRVVAVRHGARNILCSATLELASAATHGTLLRQRQPREEASTSRPSSPFAGHLHRYHSDFRNNIPTCLFANLAKVPARDDGRRRGNARL